ncbi:S9 family peptidase [Streptomonospora wellingtoniae]|uniref:Prolyl oligopeptidase family serine peptidase n=1 Tax=Streptomonospora wellingtoniae TaxID=3075544 RepID=A0ABU2KS95_9ACTN|nr:prolyl oligopeptidase family serine peptidase [Streptomonospora sp. DSM 45055]MDT0302161.1 prolyl oligopeptidase family serine peptidase [Streptomonospora sp. DSM 45055]
MTDRVTAPYGAWPSPIAASDVARGERRLGHPSVAGDEIWWEESRPDEGGRTTVMHRDSEGALTELLGPEWDAGTRVHEYGGRSFLPVPRRGDKAITRYGIVFANRVDQRLYLLAEGAAAPVPITPEPEAPSGLRYADPALGADGESLVCVQERFPAPDAAGQDAHKTRPVRSVVSIPLSGSAAEDPGAVTELVSGADFYAAPSPAPDGRHLAWISWNHPRMPWDGTELRVGLLHADGPVTDAYTLKGGVAESVLSPLWRDSTTLAFLSDWSGWWNLYEIGLTGPAIALYPAEEEFTHGFSLGMQPYRRLDDGRLVALHGHADLTPSVYDPDTAELSPLETGLESWQTLSSDGATVVGLAAGTHTPQSLVRLDIGSGRTEVLRRSREDLPEAGYLPTPRTTEFSGRYGGTVHAAVYPPAHPGADGEGPAPYVVWVHGGPVAKALGSLDLAKAYFTSRGIGVVDVNHGGSIGFGRTYRERLHGQWGVVDVEDATAAARALVEEGVADPERLAVRGGSAGGLTTLLALCGDTFACGTSSWGVTDLLRLAAETHDFESRYLDGLVGPLPGYAATYRERSPINRVADLAAPVLILQGTDDPVVPPTQARALASGLAERSIRHALLEFDGEGHGLRSAANQQRALEAELAFYGEVFGFTPPGVPPIELVADRAAEDRRADGGDRPDAAAESSADGSGEQGEADADLVAEPLPPLDGHGGAENRPAGEQAGRRA